MKHLIHLFTCILVLSVSAGAQVIKSVSPNIAYRNQTLDVNITGNNTHFSQGFSIVNFFRGASPTYLPVLNTNIVNDTLIIATLSIPQAATIGYYTLTVSQQFDGALTVSNALRVLNPYLTSVLPLKSERGKTLHITITGIATHFVQDSTIITYMSQGTPTTITLNNILIHSPDSLTADAQIPQNLVVKSYDLKITTPLDISLNYFGALTILGPKIASVSPSTGIRGETLDITITGSYTNFTQGSSVVSFFKGASPTYLPVNSSTVLNDTTIRANISISLGAEFGSYNCSVNQATDGLMTMPNAFAVVSPYLGSVTPGNAGPGQTLTVSITGFSTHFSQGNTSVLFMRQGFPSMITVNNLTVISPTILSAEISIPQSIAGGAYDLVVLTPVDGILNLPGAFYVNSPYISNANPNALRRGTTLDIEITGSYTHFNQGTGTSVSFFYQGSPTSRIHVNQVSAVSANILRANVTVQQAALAGNYELVTDNTADHLLSFKGIYVYSASGVKILPSFSRQGTVLNVEISGTGTNFTQASASSFSFFRSGSSTYLVAMTSFTALSDTTAIAGIAVSPTAPVGFYNWQYVQELDGILSGSFQVTQSTQSLKSVDPDFGEPGQTLLNVTITGLDTKFSQISSTILSSFFLQGSPTTQLVANSFIVVDDTTLRAEIMVGNNAKSGSYALYLWDIGGTMMIGKENAFMVIETGMAEWGTNSWKCYPNPAGDEVFIESRNEALVHEITWYDESGRLIKTESPETPTKVFRSSTGELKSGLYYLKITTTNGQSGYERIMKK